MKENDANRNPNLHKGRQLEVVNAQINIKHFSLN